MHSYQSVLKLIIMLDNITIVEVHTHFYTKSCLEILEK